MSNSEIDDSSQRPIANPDESVVTGKLSDANTPTFQVEFDPEEAELAGAFSEDALNEEAAMESGIDLAIDSTK